LVAGLTASVALILIVSTAVSTVFAVRASNREPAERNERIRAEDAESDTMSALNEIEKTIVRGLLQPLDAEGDAKDVLGLLEVKNVWELAREDGGSLGVRFVEEATRDPVKSRQLCARSEPALIAAVGLDQNKRQQALDLLMKRLAEPGMRPAHKADVALTVLELTDRPGPETQACEEALAGAINAVPPAHLLAAWKQHLSRNVELMEPEATTRLILLVLPSETDAANRGDLAVALVKAASRLDTAKAAALRKEALGLLTDVQIGETNFESRRERELARGVAALATHMPRGEAIRSLTAAVGRVAYWGARPRVVEGLESGDYNDVPQRSRRGHTLRQRDPGPPRRPGRAAAPGGGSGRSDHSDVPR
jgi:hypothetical protein